MTVQISSFEHKQVGVKGFVSEARIAAGDSIPAITIALRAELIGDGSSANRPAIARSGEHVQNGEINSGGA